MKIEIFPDEYDVREVIQYYTMPYTGVGRFFQGLGILFAASGKSPIAVFAENLLLEYSDYLELQRLALSGGTGNRISGFTLSSGDWLAENTDDLFRDVTEERNKQIAQSSADRPSVVQPHFEKLNKTSERITGSLEYQQVSPGKVVLLNKAPESVEFQVKPIDKRLWRVTCFPDSNQDVRVLGKTFSKMANGAYRIEEPVLEPLEIPKRIEFYDTLLLTEIEDWQFEEVIGMHVRQPEDRELVLVDEGDEERGEDDGIRQPTPSDLRGINQAILKGHRLRTNSFVKGCEKEGFYFSSMTIRYRYKKEPEVMNLTVRFKLKPRMFEIALEETFLVQDLGQLEPCTFEWQRQQEILHAFWNICNGILDQLTEKPAPEDRQLVLPRVLDEGHGGAE
jgi:hypothetical protein